MTYEKKPKEFIVKSIDDGEYIMPANMLAVSKEDYDELTAENAKLRAENYVLRDKGCELTMGLLIKLIGLTSYSASLRLQRRR
jgi:hypothetical protein